MLSASHVTLLQRKGEEDYFSSKLRVRIKDNKNSPRSKFHRFLVSFSSTFSDLRKNVLYIYPCYATCHTQWKIFFYCDNYSPNGVRYENENKAYLWIISALQGSSWSQITFCILTNALTSIPDRFCQIFEQINISP